jgi:hypothetical protein
MKLLARLLVIPIFFLGIVSCENDDNNNDSVSTTTFSATLNGANERPQQITTDAAGTAVLIYDNNAKTFTLTVNYSGLTPVAGHIHKGGINEAGPVVFPLSVGSSPINFTSPVLTAEQEADLLSGNYYVNLHSATYPDGEIRGQLVKQAASAPTSPTPVYPNPSSIPNPNPNNPNPNPNNPNPSTNNGNPGMLNPSPAPDPTITPPPLPKATPPPFLVISPDPTTAPSPDPNPNPY